MGVRSDPVDGCRHRGGRRDRWHVPASQLGCGDVGLERRNVMRKIALLTVIALAGAGCGGSEEAPKTSAGAPETEQEMTIVARDFGFDLAGLESVAPGEIQLTLENQGKQSHEA